MAKHISELKNIGIGKSVLLIGGGTSAQNIPDIKVDCTINANYPFHGRKVDYVVAQDSAVSEHIKEHGKDFKLISTEISSLEYDYYWNKHELVYVDSGHHALQIATKTMGFSTIYLIGFDYCTVSGKIHYYDKDEDFYPHYNDVMFKRAFNKYTRPYCTCIDVSFCQCERIDLFKGFNIINLNPDSRLECFPKWVKLE